MQPPKMIANFKYLSIFNYGFDILAINQWENVGSFHCDFDIEVLCMSDGHAVMKEIKLNSVNLN
jgi:hypothetical protein